MNRVILSAVTALCLAGIAVAQTINVPPMTPVQQAASLEYNKLAEEWKEISGVETVGRTDAFGEMYVSIREDFPMDPEIQKQVKEIEKQRDEDMEAAAKAAGYSSVDEAVKAHNTKVQEIYVESVNKMTPLTQPYYWEVSYRYHLAAIDALKRLIENAKAMK